MADVVQFRLEGMLDELDDLEQRGLFSRREIAEIVKQRRKFEYRLKRPCPLKQDYVAYIDYETHLDSLRRLRKKAVSRELKKQGNKKMRKSVSDFACVKRILYIYRLAVSRYKGDIDLWFRYLEFCRAQKNGRMKKVLAQLIRFHPKVPGVWVYAAAWEFDHDTNVDAARSLMLSGLRVCPTSEDLWVEYLRMELTYLNKLKARKVALGEDEGSLVRENKAAEDKQWREENKDLFMSIGEDREDNDGSVGETESKNKLDLFREQGSNILETIYNGAIEALPSSFSLRKRVLEILEAMDLAHSEELHSKILQDIKRDFGTEPQYWDWLARLQYNPDDVQGMSDKKENSRIEKAVQVYEEGLEHVPSSAMFSLYVEFLMNIITSVKEEQSSGLSSCTMNTTSRLLMVYEKALTLGHITDDLACQYVSFYLQLGKLDEARKLAERLCSGKLSNSVKLWVLRVSTEIKSILKDSPSPSDLKSIFELTKEVLRDFPVSESGSLWLTVLKFFANQSHYFDQLVEISLLALAKSGGSEDGFSLSSAIVDFVLQKDGIQRTREVYKKFLGLPHPGLAIYRTCIQLESNLASAGDKNGLASARKLFESALATYGQDVSLWQEYYIMESKMGSSETAAAIRWRARKTLKDSTALATSSDL
ncbi:U3 small nucleolar RNA-associated protein 6 homolog [Cucurbita moschata]|uniref:U3 small nucleolar RNA-associated protein 6 homolog n=1 Tax=Cucurbita moschata TaxID=3662 RepID=A0A6J1EJG1_CUCMO|nr:U3 small nucleolar RNA-associated protein 6 homolog [Cucurbita moschata]